MCLFSPAFFLSSGNCREESRPITSIPKTYNYIAQEQKIKIASVFVNS